MNQAPRGRLATAELLILSLTCMETVLSKSYEGVGLRARRDVKEAYLHMGVFTGL